MKNMTDALMEAPKVERKFPGVIDRRRRYLRSKIDLSTAKLLEIGAMDMPTFYPDEANISFLDYFSDEEFRDLASQNKISRPVENLVHVDIVAKEKYFAARESRRFDVIIAAHVIEHIADPIAWLGELETLLTEGGRIFLCIPDRRYTFDYLRRESTGLDLLKSYYSDARVPDLFTIADFYFHNRRLSAADCWGDADKLQEKLSQKSYNLKSAIARAETLMISGDVHVNVHAHVFSYPTFSNLWQDLNATGILKLDVEDSVDAFPGSNEFWALLRVRSIDLAAPRKASKARKYLAGKDGVLFLDNDTNSVLDQITGRQTLDASKRNHWTRVLETRAFLLNRMGIRYIFAVVPTKEVVLQKYLPDSLVVSDERPVEVLRRSLEGTVDFEYPLAELCDPNNPYSTFSAGDTHWTEYGAFVAYRAIFERAAQDLGFALISDSQIQISEIERFGDLQMHADQAAPERVPGVLIRAPQSRLVFDNKRHNRGRLLIYENEQAPDVRAVIFRDSFTETMLPFLAETFRRVTILWNPFVDYDLVEKEKPHLVVNIMAERFLSEVPDDGHRFGHEEIALLRRIRGSN